jgi:hypothetical protein
MVEQKSESKFSRILDCRNNLIAHVDKLQREKETSWSMKLRTVDN